MEGYTDRLVIDYSRFRDIQNWLFELAYDRAVFEQQFVPTDNLHIPDTDNVLQRLPTVNIHMGHQGAASETFNFAQDIVRTALRIDQNGRIGIGRRHNRSVSIIKNTEIQIPNIFQLSSGEVSLLTMFLAIVRDFDLLASNSATGGNIRGIVIIDEIDLHLHTVQQYEILPKLMSLFPNVQFLVTSHSPLFVLGLQREFGENRIALLQLPDGKQIGAEGFEEFGSAYGIMRQTRTFEQELEAVLNQSERPVICFDGGTDIKYLKRAAELLGKQDILDSIEVIGGGGDGELGKIWRASGVLHEAGAVKRKVVISHDCDSNTTELDKQWGARRMIARIESNPIKEGVENLFPEETLRRAMGVKEAFIDIQGSHRVTERGETRTEPERWRVNADEKSNLCEWMCENGEKEDFSSFGLIFDILAEVMKEGEVESKLEEGSSGASEGATN